MKINDVSSQDNKKEENAWLNKEIKNAIKLRKSYNRQKRNENNEVKKNVLGNLYNEQKKRVQSLIRDAITKHEIKTTKERSSKKLWDVINILRGKKRNEAINTDLYNENILKIPQELWPEHIDNFWIQIYQKHPNTITKELHEEEIHNYKMIIIMITIMGAYW